MSVTDPTVYAKLPGGTKVYFSTDLSVSEAASMSLLEEMDGVGETGKTGGFATCTRIIDADQEKYIPALEEGADKEFVLLDNPTGTNLTAFLAAAAEKKTVNIRIDYPNKRWAVVTVALAGWAMQELDKSKPMYVVVRGKQNSIDRGVTAS